MKKFFKTLKHHFNKNLWIIYLLGLSLSLIGSFQVYHGKYDSVIKEISVIFISVLKLFLFSPLEGFTKQNPLAYELAIWFAPVTMFFAIFSIFAKLYNDIKLKFIHFRKKHIIVMGYNNYSLTFMKNFINSKNKERLLCILPEDIQESNIKSLNKSGILTCTLDYSSGLSNENIRTASEYDFASVNTVICFEEEPKNYGYLKLISELIDVNKKDKNSKVKVYVSIVNKYIREIIQHQMDKIKIFDIKYFNIFDLISYNLINEKNFKLYETKELKYDWNEAKESLKNNFSFDDFSGLIGNPHLLLIGFKDRGKSLFELAVNQTAINVKEKMKITVADRKINDLAEEYRATVRELEKVANIDFIDGDISHISTQNKIKKIHAKNPFSSVIFSTKNCSENLIFMDLVGDELFKNVNIALYCENIQENEPLIKSITLKYPNVTVFGESSNLLNLNNIANEPLDIKAKNFNAYYNKVAADIMNYPSESLSPDEQWNSLSNIKKESSRNQCMHQNIKKVLLEKIAETEGFSSVQELLQSWKNKIDGLSAAEQVNIIENSPSMNYMTALEHKRWNNFYYMKNFVYSDEKNEVNRTHNSLIDDWDEFLRSDQSDKAVYDFISVLSAE